MKRKMFFLLCLSLFISNDILAWDNNKTHPKITEIAIKESQIDNYIKNALALKMGINYPLTDRQGVFSVTTEILCGMGSSLRLTYDL